MSEDPKAQTEMLYLGRKASKQTEANHDFTHKRCRSNKLFPPVMADVHANGSNSMEDISAWPIVSTWNVLATGLRIKPILIMEPNEENTEAK